MNHFAKTSDRANFPLKQTKRKMKSFDQSFVRYVKNWIYQEIYATIFLRYFISVSLSNVN